MNVSGSTTINAGTVADLRIAATASETVALNGTVQIGSSSSTPSGLIGGVINNAVVGLAISGGTLQFGGEAYVSGSFLGGITSTINAPYGLHKMGYGDWILAPSGTNNFGTTGLILDGASRTFLTGGSMAAEQNALGNGAVTLNNGAILEFFQAGTPSSVNFTFNTGSSVGDRGGTLNVTASPTVTSSVGYANFPSTGIMKFSFDDSAQGAINVGGTWPTMTGNLTLAVGGGSTNNSGTVGQVTIASMNTGTGGNTLNFSGNASGSTAGFIVSALTLGSSSTLSTATATTVAQVGTITDNTSGYGLTLSGLGTIQLNGAGSFSGGVNVAGGTVTTSTANSLGTGPLAVGAGSITIGASQSVSSATINGGSVTVSNGNALGTGTLTLNGGTLAASGGVVSAGNVVATSATGTSILPGGGDFDFMNNSTSGTLTGTGNIIVGATPAGAAVAVRMPGNLSGFQGTFTYTDNTTGPYLCWAIPIWAPPRPASTRVMHRRPRLF